MIVGDGTNLTERGTPIEVANAMWDEHATWWTETFTDGADVEYAEEIVPFVAKAFTGCSRILDVGCGEGQIGRALAGTRDRPTVVGIDPSGGQLANAVRKSAGVLLNGRSRTRKGKITFVQAAGEGLPFADDSFDGVVCCLVIEHSEDADRVLSEIARVLSPGGIFLLLINHPLYQGVGSGFIDDQILGERYWRVGPYLHESVTVELVDNGIALPFAHRPLSRYINPLAERDVMLVHMYEPPPIPAFLVDAVDPELEGAIPRLLAMRFCYRP